MSSTHTIAEYEQASKALRNNDLRQGLYDVGAVLMEGVLVNLHGEEHRQRRNLESKIFRRDYFKFYENEVFPTTLEETARPFVAAGRADLCDFGFRVMLNLTADFAGIDRPERSPEETARLLAMLKTFGQAATLHHSTRDKDEVRREVRDALLQFDDAFLKPSIARRQDLLARFERGELTEEALPRDILTLLLRNEDALDLPYETLRREMGFFLLAGAFTSIHSMTHAMHEIFEWCAAEPSRWDRLENEPFLIQRCVHESTRLHPSSPIAARKPTCPMQLPDNTPATPEDDVVVDLYNANRDTSVFGPDAASFNPDRPVPKNQHLYGLSFGLGMHSCIGRNLAAGVVPRSDTDPAEHHYGTVPLIVQALLKYGARPDPNDPATMDATTKRPNWGRYPVVFTAA